MAIQKKRADVTEYYAGDEVPLVFPVVDENGDPVDLTGAVVHWVLSEFAGSPVLVDKPDGAGAAVTQTFPGEITVTPAKADTLGRLARIYHHELEVELAGKSETAAWGEFHLFATSAN